jgi:hypothetical protein
MATTEQDEINRRYHAVYCFHCGTPILFADDLDRLPEPFRMPCLQPGCQQTAAYQKSVVVQVAIGYNA